MFRPRGEPPKKRKAVPGKSGAVFAQIVMSHASFVRKQLILIMITIITILLLLTSRNWSICRYLYLIGDCHDGR